MPIADLYWAVSFIGIHTTSPNFYICYLFILFYCFCGGFSISYLYFNQICWTKHCHFWAFYSWLCGMDFAHCWRHYGDLYCYFLCHFGLLWRVVSLTIIPHLLSLYILYIWPNIDNSVSLNTRFVEIQQYMYMKTHVLWLSGNIERWHELLAIYFRLDTLRKWKNKCC